MSLASDQFAYKIEYKTNITAGCKVILNIVSVFEKIGSVTYMTPPPSQKKIKIENTPKFSLKPW